MAKSSIVPPNTTLIDVYLKNPNGHPLTNTRFAVRLTRAGFAPTLIGVVEDKEDLYCTDDNGYAQMHLWPLSYPYILTYSYDDDSMPGHFVFYVPETDKVVQLQDLIFTPTDSNDTYEQDVLDQIIAAKAEVTVLAAEAEASAEDSATSATTASNAATVATQKAAETDEDREQVADIQLQLQLILSQMTEAIVKIQGINLQNKLLLGGYQLWVDAAGKLRIKYGAPTSDTDGTVVGDQTA